MSGDSAGERVLCVVHERCVVLLVLIAVLFMVLLHPELKAFYALGYGDVKNTVSAIDMGAAALALILIRTCWETLVERPNRRCRTLLGEVPHTVQHLAIPALLVFFVITLSTLANFLSFETYIILGPTELVFAWLFARAFHAEERRASLATDAPSVVLVTLGSCLFVADELATGHGDELKPWTGIAAVAAALACRVCQALNIVAMRTAALTLMKPTRGRPRSLAEVVQWKLTLVFWLCLAYGLVTEGTDPWSKLSSREFWSKSAPAALLVGSVVLTVGLHCSQVALNATLRSPTVAVLLSALQPLLSILLALLLQDPAIANWIRLKPFRLSAVSLVGTACLASGVAVHVYSRLRRPRVRAANLEDLSLQPTNAEPRSRSSRQDEQRTERSWSE